MTGSILVLGAGELGLAVLEALAAHPQRATTRISVLLRQATLDSAAAEKKQMIQHLRALKIGFEAADVVEASTEELSKTMSGYDTVVSCNGMGLPSGTQIKLSEAVLAAKTTTYFPWQFGMDYDAIGQGSSQDLFDEQLQVRKRLRAQNETDWVILSTGLFMSFLFEPAFGTVDVAQKQVRALGSWDNTITLSTPRDIGRVAADVLLDRRGIRSQVVFMAGDTVSYQQVAELVDSHFRGSKFTRTLWDLPTLARQKEEKPDDGMIKYRDAFAQGRGVAWPKNSTVNHERGIDTTDLAAYLRENFPRE